MLRRLSLLLFLVLITPLIGCDDDGDGGDTKDEKADLVIFQTNDRHSHWLGLPNTDYNPLAESDSTVGGVARWYPLVKAERDAGKEVLLLSAGDFTMGTLLVVAEDTAADLNLMTELGYDAAALGNHEFDWGPAALAEMISAANKPLVPLLAANINFSDTDPADDSLEALYGMQGEEGKFIFPYIIKETESGTRVGIFGLMGENAEEVSLAKPVTFSKGMEDMIATAQEVTNTLRNEEGVDLVVCVAHLGIVMDEGEQAYGGATFETIQLAQGVEGIDIILSGHAHTVVEEPILVDCEKEGSDWVTMTLEAGAYGRHLGRYDVSFGAARPDIEGQLVTIEDNLPADEALVERVDAMVRDVEETLLKVLPQDFLNGDYYQILTTSSFDIPRHYNENNNLGYLAADAIREDAGAQVAVISNGGDIRESLKKVGEGGFAVGDTFIVTPLGGGNDGTIGYPIVKFHLTLFELQLILESTVADAGQFNNEFMLNLSGVKITFDSSAGIYSRVKTITLYDEDETAGELVFDRENGGFLVPEYETLLTVTTTSYIASFLSSFNLRPRDAAGEVLESFDGLYVLNPDGTEVKLWYSLQRKLASFSDGVPNLYNDDESLNPAGPYWRRAIDLAVHPQ